MRLTIRQFSDLVYKVAQARATNSSGRPDNTWHPEDLGIMLSTVAEDIGLTLTFAESMGLINQKEETNE